MASKLTGNIYIRIRGCTEPPLQPPDEGCVVSWKAAATSASLLCVQPPGSELEVSPSTSIGAIYLGCLRSGHARAFRNTTGSPRLVTHRSCPASAEAEHPARRLCRGSGRAASCPAERSRSQRAAPHTPEQLAGPVDAVQQCIGDAALLEELRRARGQGLEARSPALPQCVGGAHAGLALDRAERDHEIGALLRQCQRRQCQSGNASAAGPIRQRRSGDAAITVA